MVFNCLKQFFLLGISVVLAQTQPKLIQSSEFIKSTRSVMSFSQVEGQFHQKKTISSLGIDLQSSGKFMIDKTLKPAKVTWNVLKPAPMKILIQKDQLVLDAGDQVEKLDLRTKAQSGHLAELIDWLNWDASSLSQRYQVFLLSKKTYELKPRKKEKNAFQKIRVSLGKSGYLSHLEFTEQSGDLIEIKFLNVKVSQ